MCYTRIVIANTRKVKVMTQLTETLFDSNDYVHDTYGEEFQESYNELMENLDQVKGRWKITGTLGLWDGRHDIEPVEMDSLKEAVEKCFGSNDYIKLMTNGELYFVDGVHHDGTNRFVISRIA